MLRHLDNRKKTYLIIIIIWGVAGLLISRFVVSQWNKHELFNIVEAINKDLPTMVSTDIRADLAVAGPGLVVSYFYTVTAPQKAMDISNSRDTVSNVMLQKYCPLKSFQYFSQRGVKIMLVFRNVNGEILVNNEISADRCKAFQ